MNLLFVFALISVLVVNQNVNAHGQHDESLDHQPDHHEYHRDTGAVGDLFASKERCGATSPSDAEKQEAARVVSKWVSSDLSRLNVGTTTEIDTYFHVITNGAVGAINDTSLLAQLKVLNDSFLPSGFSFKLLGTTRTDNADWFNAGLSSDAQSQMISSLRKGTAKTLNVYFNNVPDLLGYASYPMYYNDFPVIDGVVIQSDTIPGGAASSHNQGKVLVHETGHWLGLYHTFEIDFSPGKFWFLLFLLKTIGISPNQCIQGNGDEVNDTPVQKTPTIGCPVRKDTCPLRLGMDPIHNYMDYSDDVCRTEFTKGQAKRMLASWNEYRAGK
jgi:Pregnancy-associated plasma protein-A